MQTKKRKLVKEVIFNIIAFSLIAGALIWLAAIMDQVTDPLAELHHNPVTLNPKNLIEYSFYTLSRMLAALLCSFVFSLIYASIAAKSRKAEQILIPLLDILQSVPILGYISFTVTIFLTLFPGKILGAECAAVFALFTSQVWNMTFSVYQSLKMVPQELHEASSMFKMPAWQKFWRVEVPYALPNLMWNVAVSMSGGWFFIVAAEVISVGNKHIILPGVGSYIALALENQETGAIIQAVIAMIITIIFYDQLLIKTLTAWANKFKYDTTTASQQKPPTSWVYNLLHNSLIVQILFLPFKYLGLAILNFPLLNYSISKPYYNYTTTTHETKSNVIWYLMLATIFAICGYKLYIYLLEGTDKAELLEVIYMGFITATRVFVMLTLAVIIWVPVGIIIGLSPRLSAILMPFAQFLAAFPANILFPIVVIYISRYNLNPDIWLSPLVIVGSQWYILFNVIAGARRLPNDLIEAAENLHVKGALWLKKVMLPAIIPTLLTGVITAAGGAWNATIIAEVVYYGDKKIAAHGLGKYITEATLSADFYNITLGILVMSAFVVLINRLCWRPLQTLVAKKFQL